MKVTRNIFEYYINTHEIIKEIMWLFFLNKCRDNHYYDSKKARIKYNDLFKKNLSENIYSHP